MTWNWIAQLNKIDANSPDFLYSVMYYDDKKQLIQSKSTNHLGGLEKESIAYNFIGQPIQRKHVHSATGNNAQSEIYAYTYDHAGRLLKTVHHLIDGVSAQTPVTLVENEYDELGRLRTNMKGGRAELNSTYTYNIRSWTKSISNPLFNQTLYYNESYGGSAKRYNGNIAGMTWKVWDSATSKWEKERGYSFTYDNLSRLRVANYLENGMVNTNYRTSYSYDKHGNLITLNQRGRKDASLYGQVDSLKMTYSGNQLTKVTDAVPNFAYAASADFKNYGGSNAIYTYNLNGAMTTDSHKGILGIQYNSLNLPYELLIKNTEISGKVYYTYSALGAKLKAKYMKAQNLGYTPVTGTAGDVNLDVIKTTDYVGNLVYENDSLKRVLVNGGYIEVTRVNGVNQYAYNYYLTDHLGNNRVVVNVSGTPIQKNHYYPFGMAFAEGTTTEQGKQPYKYNGKELDQMHGLNLYDYSARYYEPAIGRFTMVDPHAENYYGWSPYHYVGNNPMKYIDPNGKDWGVVINHENKTITIAANFTAITAGEKGNNTLQAARSNWNAQSGKFNYVVGTGSDAVSYSVNFFVTTSNNTPDMPQNEMQVLSDNNRVFKTTNNSDGTVTTAEGVSDEKIFAVKESRNGDKKAVAHEMGHNLGMNDGAGGLMEGNLNSSNELTSTSVGQTLHQSGIQNTSASGGNTNATLTSTKTIGTAPKNFQGGNLVINKEWEKKNF
ncbi:RHS repeat domain-containing protein [Dysgonomonas sp.]